MEMTRKQRIQLQEEQRKLAVRSAHFKTIRKVTTIAGASTLLATGVLSTANGQALVGATPHAAQAAVSNDFLNQIAGPAQQLASQNDLYASVMIAQAALESGWGSSALSAAPNYNLFGMKGAYNGQSVTMGTSEDDGSGHLYGTQGTFRRYSSYTESLQDYVNKIRYGTTWNSTYYSGAWKSNTNSYQDATRALTGKYATDTSYNTRLNRLIETYNLTQYDAPASAGQINQDQFYTVSAGDTVWQLAERFGVSIEQIVSLNNLNNYMIVPGQTIQITKKTTAPVVTDPSQPAHYTVQQGDLVWALAIRFGITEDQLTSWNGIQNNFIYPGLDLVVSQGNTTSIAANRQTYTVVKGDSLWRISQNHGLTLNQLKSLNNMTTNMIHPGNVLFVS